MPFERGKGLFEMEKFADRGFKLCWLLEEVMTDGLQ